jgi:diaminopimelate decarboxylase
VLDGAPRAFGPERWGLDFVPGRGLTLEGLALHELLERWGSPLHVVHAAKLRDNARRFLAVPEGCQAGCEVFYSYKTNPIGGVLSTLHELGLGAEVISPHELSLAERLGVPARRTIYNGPGKSDESLRFAMERGIEIINCNHHEEIARVARIARDSGRRARIGIRVSTGDGWSSQFGVPIEGGKALAAFAEARATGVLDVVGVHAHRGGMLSSEPELRRFITPILALTDELEQKLSLRLEILNFGGSLGTPTVRGLSPRDRRVNQTLQRELRPPDADRALSIERYLEVLVTSVERYFAKTARPRPRVFVEPGRAMTGDSQMLLSKTLTTKSTEGSTFLVLDAGINLAESARSEYHQLFSINRFGEPRTRVHTVVGPICSPMDTLYPAVRLPALAPGDSVAIMDAGAYFVPFATSFSFPQPAVIWIEQGQASLLRRRETFDDVQLCDVPVGSRLDERRTANPSSGTDDHLSIK